MGLLGSEHLQTHCFFSGGVDFYYSWCKWADKGTVGTGLWPSCLLSHCGKIVVSLCHTDSGFFSSAHDRPVWSRFQRGTLLQASYCVGPKTLEGHRKHHTLLNNVIRENSWEAGEGMTVISRVIFSIVICYWARLLEFLSPFLGTFFVVWFPLQIHFHYLWLSVASCVSLPQSLRHVLSTMPCLMFKSSPAL